MKWISLIVILISLNACSTVKKTLIYSSLAGAMTGAISGAVLSPDSESRGANMAVFGAIGAGVAALTGLALYNDDPRNYELKNMLMNGASQNPVKQNDIQIGLGDLKIDANLDRKEAYEVPVKKLPEKLKGKVNKQYLIKYQSKERYIKRGAKTFYIPAFEVYEHAYGETPDALKGEGL